MDSHLRIIFAAAASVAALALLVGGASANRLELTNSERGFRLVWAGEGFEAGGTTVRCNLTLEGSFTSRSLVKRAGTLIGRVTRGGLESCSGGIMRVNSETMPWTVTYQSFTGTLPAITGITKDVLGATFEVQPTGFPNCRFSTSTAEPMRGIANVNGSGELTTLRLEESSTIGSLGGFLCLFGTRGRFIGTATESVLGESAKPRIRLI